jgi:hypothetical protein
MRDHDEKRRSARPLPAAEKPDPSNVVPFPAGRRKPAASPEDALFDLDDFDPGPGAA